MGLFGSLRSALGGRVDLWKRFDRQQRAISGTMSNFYLAFDAQTRRKVGLKVLDPAKTAAFAARFPGLNKPSEGQIAVALDHPNIVKTYEHGVARSGEQFLVMEYLEGQGLNSLLVTRSKLLDGRRAALVRQAAEAVAAVHAAGYIHRDICPRNFVILPDGTLKLIDFGLTVPATDQFMQPGNRTGTPDYMAPEIVRRRRTDQRVDIFALGVTAFEICTFELPWASSEKTGKAALAHDTQPPRDILELRPRLDPRLARMIMRSLAASPAERPQSAEEVLRMIEGVERDEVG